MLGRLATLAGARCVKFNSQTGMRSTEVIARSPSLELFGQFEPGQRCSPGAPSESGDALP